LVSLRREGYIFLFISNFRFKTFSFNIKTVLLFKNQSIFVYNVYKKNNGTGFAPSRLVQTNDVMGMETMKRIRVHSKNSQESFTASISGCGTYLDETLKSAIVILLVTALLVISIAPTQAAIVTDNFNRPDGSLGTNWAKPTASEHNIVIVSNQAGVDVEDSHNYAYWVANSFNDDQYSQANITKIGHWIGVILRADSVQDRFYLGLVMGVNDYRIYARWDGWYYQLARMSTGGLECDGSSLCDNPAPLQTWQVGDVFRLEVTGSSNPVTITMYRNRNAILTWTSTLPVQVRTGGSPGIGIYSPSGQGLTLDNWEGGNVVPEALQTEAIQQAQNLQTIISMLNISVFKNSNMKNGLLNKVNAVIANIEAGDYAYALDQLQNDILAKTGGCATSGSRDKNDWLKTCDAQNQVYPYIIQLIQLVQGMI
jgi:hypothetical protein